MSYTEFPTDRIVDVHFKKKTPPDGEPPPHDGACGEFPCGSLFFPMSRSFAGGVDFPFCCLSIDNFYGAVADSANPGHKPTQPAAFFPLFADYGLTGCFPPAVPNPSGGLFWPMIWENPCSWTVTRISQGVDFITGDNVPFPGWIEVYYNTNPQAFWQALQGHPLTEQAPVMPPDDFASSTDGYTVINVAMRPDDWYEPILRFNGGNFHYSVSAHFAVHIQSYCNGLEVSGPLLPVSCADLAAGVPTQLPGWGTSFWPTYEYPVAGQTDWPMKGPPDGSATLSAAAMTAVAPGVRPRRQRQYSGVDTGVYIEAMHDCLGANADRSKTIQRARNYQRSMKWAEV